MLIGFIGCLLLFSLCSAIFKDGWLSPPKFISLVFMCEFGLQATVASHMVESNLSALAIIIFIICFIVGYILYNRLNNFSRFSSLISYSIKNNLLKKRVENILLVMIFLSFLGSVVYSTAFEIKSFSSLLSDGGLRRELMMSDELSIPYFSKLGFILCYAVVIISTVYYIFYGSLKYIIPSLIPLLILGLAQSGRAGIMYSCLIILIGSYFRHLAAGTGNKYNLIKKLVYFTIFMVIIFLGGRYARYGFDADYSSLIDSLRSLSDYFFGGLSGFANYINLNMFEEDLAFGSFTFSGLFQLFGLTVQEKGLYNEYVSIDQSGGVTNLYSGFRPFIDDFGFFGAAVCFGFAGYISSVICNRVISGRIQYFSSLVWVYLWISLLPICTITIYNSFLAALIIPFFVFKICLKNE